MSLREAPSPGARVAILRSPDRHADGYAPTPPLHARRGNSIALGRAGRFGREAAAGAPARAQRLLPHVDAPRSMARARPPRSDARPSWPRLVRATRRLVHARVVRAGRGALARGPGAGPDGPRRPFVR